MATGPFSHDSRLDGHEKLRNQSRTAILAAESCARQWNLSGVEERRASGGAAPCPDEQWPPETETVEVSRCLAFTALTPVASCPL